ncbi:DUF4892 domain-containing protein [Salinispirillum sp. LH 10-3-1]|uniref:DUF4892 domain-containing protein n=1 Tax=Salinispirillum sp. LH 10-3-1 TaxID=2952525 RepID=A0AB38YC97_9GAMM
MNKIWLTGVAVALSLALPSNAWASSVADVLRGFQPSRLMDQSVETEPQQFWWLKSAVKRIGSDYVADNEERLEVQRLRWELYEISSNHSEAAIYERIMETWKAEGYEETFSCRAVSCGSSQHWAVHVFGIPMLYGLNRNQFYSTGKVDGNIRVLYVVRRGTQTNYVYWLEASQQLSSDVIPDRLRAGAAIRATDYEPDVWLDILDRHPEWSLMLVGHDYSSSLGQARAAGQAAADQVRDRWTSAGVAGDRVNVDSVGYLAPNDANPQARVKVILPPQYR